jgi:hypothetical protein
VELRVQEMNAVVIGGHTRNIGKTSVMTALINGLRCLDWTAVKITQYGHGICSRDGEPCGCAPREHPFVLSEEGDARGRWDTCRYLAAGARRSLWLRVRQGQLAEAFPALCEALGADDHVMMESNSIMGLLRPAVYLLVVDSSARDFKATARHYLALADALVPVESRIDAAAWTGLDSRLWSEKPVFPVTPSKYASPDLCRFVWKKLGLRDVDLVSAGLTSTARKEQTCPR